MEVLFVAEIIYKSTALMGDLDICSCIIKGL